MHADRAACPDAMIAEVRGGYGLYVRDGEDGYGTSVIAIAYCPWCGAKLPSIAEFGEPPVVILHTPLAEPDKLDAFVEDCLSLGVRLIAVAGPDAALIEDIIDEIVVGDGTKEYRFIVTTSHAGQPIDDVIHFASAWNGGSAVREVRL